MDSLAPPSPHVEKSESMARHFLRQGPPTSSREIWPAGASGTERGPQIGYWAPLHRWIITARAWLRAVKSTFPGLPLLSAAAYAGASFAAGGCAPVCRPMHVRRAARDSSCAIGGAVPEVGRPAAHISESVVCPPGLSLPFGGLLWAARSAVACPAARGVARPGTGVARLSPDGGPPRQLPAVGVRGSIPRVGPLGTGVRPCCCGVSASR